MSFRSRHHVGELSQGLGLWCSYNSPLRYQGLGTLVVTVNCDFVASQTTAALLFCHAAVSAHIIACQIAYTLPLAPQL